MTKGIFDSSVADTPAVSAKGTNGAHGIDAVSDTGTAVSGVTGVSGSTFEGIGVYGHSGAQTGIGVKGEGPQIGVNGVSQAGIGVRGTAAQSAGIGVLGEGHLGLSGYTVTGIGVSGESDAQTGIGVQGKGPQYGVEGVSQTGIGVHGIAAESAGIGVFGEGHLGLSGYTVTGIGVSGESDAQTGIGVKGEGRQYGVEGVSSFGIGIHGSGSKGAGFFEGNVTVTGDVILTGADCAEEFDTAQAAEIQPGTVMVLDQDGALQHCQQAYDKRVAGVISGAGNYKPGLILDRQQAHDDRVPIALVGKVYCKVDAQYAPIEVGDLLTTSSTLGHAMKAEDPLRAFGSVIGKALRPLQAGQGLIPILIALQ